MHDPADHERCRDANLPPEACPVHERFSVFHQALLHDWIIDLHAGDHPITFCQSHPATGAEQQKVHGVAR